LILTGQQTHFSGKGWRGGFAMHYRSYIILLVSGMMMGLIWGGTAWSKEKAAQRGRLILGNYELTYKKDSEGFGYFVQVNRSGKMLLVLEPGDCVMIDLAGAIKNKPAKGCQSLTGYCFSGGAHCCTTAILLTVCGSNHSLDTLHLAHSSQFNWTNANDDGNVELALADWSFAYYAVDPENPTDLFLPFAFSPAFRRLAVWDGKKWRTDRIGEFKAFYSRLLQEGHQELQIASKNQEDIETVVALAIEAAYYTLMAGKHEKQAWEILRKFLPPPWQSHRDKILEDIKTSTVQFNPFS
jgi:hypothetical protein